MKPNAPQPTLRDLIARLKGEVVGLPKRPGFGTCVGELRRQLTEMPNRGRSGDDPVVAEARAIMAELDQRHLSAIAARILKDINASKRPANFMDDVGRLRRFVEGSCRVFEPYESSALAHGLALLGELHRRGIKQPRPQGKQPPQKKLPAKSYVHHPTLDDDYDVEQRITLVLGGAFEMNRRRH